ncbi:MAG: hypothetical protein KF746_14325 [Chitinophagaceae bacterium]|nr:hypothetical protein [Chitinophagaceae bacterium]
MVMKGTLRTCPQGHQFYKSSDCPTCPVCEAEKNKAFFVKVSAPARRALQGSGIDSVIKLAKYSEKEILSLHGIGKTAIPVLRKVLHEHELDFKR